MTARTLALLIDADNIAPKFIPAILAEVARHGAAHVRRIYGDWTTTNLNPWKDCLLEHSLQPIQQFAHTTGKNATDVAMIIDAMDLLYTNRFSGFCLVSSDSDFSRLATRIREQGLKVYGFGEKKTPRPFVTACDVFVHVDGGPVAAQPVATEHLPAPAETAKPAPAPSAAAATTATSGRRPIDEACRNAIRKAIEAARDANGGASLTVVRQQLGRQFPNFIPKAYGYRRTVDFVEATGFVLVERDKPKKNVITVRLKPA